MKAFIFAAGYGTRLRPWTDSHPKALAPINGRTLLDFVISGLSDRAGIDGFIVNVHHFSDQVKRHIADHYADGSPEITVSDETDLLLDTGGGLLKGSALLDEEEDLLVHNVDILTDLDYAKMIDSHRKSGNDVTLLVSDRDSSRRLLFDENGMLRGWQNLKDGSVLPQDIDSEQFRPRSFGGIHILSPKALSLLEKYAAETGERKFSIIPFYLWAMERLKIGAFEAPQGMKWLDVGKPETLQQAQELFI